MEQNVNKIIHREKGFFGQAKVQEAYNIFIFLSLMENNILKVSDSVDVKITLDWTKNRQNSAQWVYCESWMADNSAKHFAINQYYKVS